MNLVYILQIMLNTLCGVYKNLRPLPVDGKYGSATEEDVMLFQSVQRLPETGYVDKITWNRLADAYNRYVDPGLAALKKAPEGSFPGEFS